ncbi:RiPP maturation radical SAM C-methyltransferase [Polymorphobacter sp.]|uniref:RiPP maturation radical SAM C-methyltransferase n=1 Tax=Polymorphobacter sp. TaxID=1909290 RepID=UPI003F716CEB
MEAGPTSEPAICLVSMPFMPGSMPALGISLLKASLADAGIGCDILYGSTMLVEALESLSDHATAIFDSQLIGSTGHLGDLMFAPLLWDDTGLHDAVRTQLALAATSLPADRRDAFLDRHDPARPHLAGVLARAAAARDWTQFRVVGFSSTFAQSVASLWLARHIKAVSPATLVLFGGANVDGTMGPALLEAFPFVDHVLQGEADHSLISYMQAVLAEAPLAGIPGLVQRDARPIPAKPVTALDALPVPDYGDYFAQRPAHWPRDEVMIPFETSRGCWWGESSHCIFCGLNGQAMGYRAKTDTRALAEIDALRARWGLSHFWAVDNILPREYFAHFLPQLGARNLSLFYETKANLHDGQVASLAAAGVTQIQPGVESLNTRLLKLMKKGTSRARNIQLLRACKAHGVDPLWFYLHGFPGDDTADYLEDAALMADLVHLPPPRSINPVTVDRFSPLYATARLTGRPALAQQGEHRLAFAGLSDATSEALCYHFDAQVGAADPRLYQPALARALAHWQQRHGEGAQLAAEAGTGCTLIFDDRAGDAPRLHLLTGLLHHVHALCDTGASQARIEEQCARLPASALAGDEADEADLPLVMAAVSHGAGFPPPVASVAEALAWLDDQRLLARDGTVWQALAVPGLTLLTALGLGLETRCLDRLSLQPETAMAPC